MFADDTVDQPPLQVRQQQPQTEHGHLAYAS
jgi:hypothetical protein